MNREVPLYIQDSFVGNIMSDHSPREVSGRQ